MLSALLVSAIVIGAAGRKAAACEPVDCLNRIAAKATVASQSLPESALLGNWSKGSGLSGSELYLFQDGSYVYTEWADVEPETIYDKGRWTLAAGLLKLSPDTDVTWNPQGNRRYLTLRETGSTADLLFGLDRTLDVFESLVEDEPQHAQDYLRGSSLRRVRTWGSADARRVKADLMKRCWRPAYFAR